MAYQCLKCGTLFADGTTTILRGCPDCKGTRFFYTEEPLSQTERDQRLHETERQLPSLVQEILQRAPLSVPEAPAKASEALQVPASFQDKPAPGRVLPDGTLLVKIPKAIEERLKRATASWEYEAPAPTPTSTAPTPPPVTTVAPPPEPAASAPETVRIGGPGQYEIDVRRLLERNPIIVQKDGTYLIHLPSLFEMPGQKRPPS